jgi:hypothetical protein
MSYLPPAMSIAFDYLDAVWRLKFEKKLLRLRLLTPTTDLERDCSTREEFQSRLSSLADTLKLLNIESRLLEKHPKKDDIKSDHTLIRPLAALEGAIALESLDPIKAALERLQSINDLRVSRQHASTNINPITASNELGISEDVNLSWTEKWNQVRAKATEALRTIAAELNASIPV